MAQTQAERPDDHPVPPAMRATAAWSWRVLVVAGVLFVLGQVVGLLHVIVLPFVAAVFLTAALVPVTSFLRARGLPRGQPPPRRSSDCSSSSSGPSCSSAARWSRTSRSW